MARTRGVVRRPTRFDQLTAEQERTFSCDAAEVVLTARLRSFKGKAKLRPFFEQALKGFQTDVHQFADAAALTDAFVGMCNSRNLNSSRSFAHIRSSLRAGVLAYASAKGLHKTVLKNWPAGLGTQVVRWLRSEARNRYGQPISANTARKNYGSFCGLFAELGENERLVTLLPLLEPFPNNPFSGAHGETAKTKSLGLPSLIAILRAARLEFLQTSRKVEHLRALLNGPVVLPDMSRKGRGQFHDLDAILFYLSLKYPERLPAFTALKTSERALFDAITEFHGGWSNVVEYFYPRPENCVAPIILLTVYGHFNVEPLRSLRLRSVRQISVLRNAQVEVRTAVQPGKERGAQPYRRSFPIDDSDPASPSSLLDTMVNWTKAIRADAGAYADCVFLFRTKDGEVKCFETAAHAGRSSDSKWKHHLKEFCKRHGHPEFNLRTLRQTSLDFAREIADNDIRELSALKGGSAQSVLDFHYKSDAHESRAQAQIALLQSNKERHIRTRGRSNHLGAPKTQDLSAATPGCKCADPYDSSILGESQDGQCSAFGCCPGCPHGSPELGSVYGLGRLLQLREVLHAAKSNIPLARWIERYKRPLEVLEGKWLPLFDDPLVWEQVKHISLRPIGVIE